MTIKLSYGMRTQGHQKKVATATHVTALEYLVRCSLAHDYRGRGYRPDCF